MMYLCYSIFMKIPHNRFRCEPFEYSNDRWNYLEAKKVREHLSAANPTQAALVIGAGTLPYTLDIMPKTVYVSDLNHGVIDGVMRRSSQLITDFSSWGEYEASLPSTGKDELAGAIESGLTGSFQEVKRKSSTVDIRPVMGDIVTTAAEVREQLNADGQVLTFVNFTNVARYLSRPTVGQHKRHQIPNGRSILAEVLTTLPLSDDALVCDSYASLKVQVLPAKHYVQVFGSTESS